MVASAPPQTMAVASPRLMISVPSPMALALDAQADMTAKLGPVMPNCMAMRPAARSVSIIGMVNGLTRRGPFLSSTWICSSMVRMPPMPEPTSTPQSGALSGVTV